MPGPLQFFARDSEERKACSSLRAAVFPLLQFISGRGLIIGKPRFEDAFLHSS